MIEKKYLMPLHAHGNVKNIHILVFKMVLVSVEKLMVMVKTIQKSRIMNVTQNV